MGMIFYAKTIVFVCYLFWVVSMLLVGLSGRKLRRTKSWMRGWEPTWHRRFAITAYAMLWVVAFSADGLHWLVRGTFGGEDSALFPLHLVCALGLFSIMTVMLFKLNGKDYSTWHGRLALVGLPLFLVVAATGPVLVVQL